MEGIVVDTSAPPPEQAPKKPTANNNNNYNNNNEDESQTNKSLRRDLFGVKIVALVLMLAVGAALAYLAYIWSVNELEKAFQESYEEQSSRLLTQISVDFTDQLRALQGLAVVLQQVTMTSTTTTSTTTTTSSWPFVTIPMLEEYVLANPILARHGVYLIPTIPTTTTTNDDVDQEAIIASWESYASTNQGWIDVAYETQATLLGVLDQNPSSSSNWFETEWTTNRGVNISNVEASPSIATQVFGISSSGSNSNMSGSSSFLFADNDATSTSTTSIPVIWQTAPISASRQSQINLNLAKSPYDVGGVASNIVQTTGEAIQAPPILLPLFTILDNENDEHDHEQQKPQDVSSMLLYPIFFDNSSGGSSSSNGVDDPVVVGELGMNVLWSRRLSTMGSVASDTSSSSSGPLTVVVTKNEGGSGDGDDEDGKEEAIQTFTYQVVDGEEAVFVQEGDGHDPAFDEYVEEIVLGETLLRTADGADDTSNNFNMGDDDNNSFTTLQYTGAPLSSRLGTYKISVYPTAELEETFQTRQPRIFAGVVILGFALLFGIFLLYDCIMQRHQRMLKESAVQSDAIVSSLFPQQVKQQLYDNYNNNDNASLTDMGDSHSLPPADDAGSLDKSFAYIPQGPPIAEHYPSSTILFADIAGFTKWSSSRAPADVFEFLERLYGGFDQAAMTHGVFKIETIGDCYVAAAGIPEPRPDHAVIMVQFAKEMLDIIRDVLGELGDRFQAHKLALRVGIHSGPVTAGVLRGEKARFQLFGDTVNTTARHESGGKPGKIHISKETAALLQEAGNGHWIKPRRDKVYMKGKGYNETYWVIPNSNNGNGDNNNNFQENGVIGGCTGGGAVGGPSEWDCGVLNFCQN